MSQQKGMNFKGFRQRFQTEEACEAYLFEQRWPDGFICPKCGGTGCYQLRGRREYVCKHCHRQSSVTVGTVCVGLGDKEMEGFRKDVETIHAMGFDGKSTRKRLWVSACSRWTEK